MAAGGRQEVIRVLKASQQLLEDTLLRNGAAVAEGLDKVHREAASILAYNDENSLSCATSRTAVLGNCETSSKS